MISAAIFTFTAIVFAVPQQESLEEAIRRQEEETRRILAEQERRRGEENVPNFEDQQKELERLRAEQEAETNRILGHGSSSSFGRSSSLPGMPIPYTLLLMRDLPFKTPGPSDYAAIQAEINAAVKAGDYKSAAEWAELLETVQKPTWRETQSETLRRTSSKVGNVGAGLLTFGGAYLGKEALHSLEEGNGERFQNAVAYTKTPQFWVSTGIAGGTMTYTASALDKSARLTQLASSAGKAGTIARTARLGVPMYAGIATLRMMDAMATGGDVTSVLVDSGVTTGSYLAAHAAVRGGTRLAVDAAVRAGARFLLGFATKGLYAPLLAAGPWGWAAAGVLFVAEAAVTMYLGDKIESWLRGQFQGGNGRNLRASTEGTEGVVDKINRIGS